MASLRSLTAQLYGGRSLPDVGLVRQRLDAPRLENVAAAASEQTRRLLRRAGRAPGPIAVGVGSRGIANLATIVGAVVRELKAGGFQPFIVPAMGSHGGGTASGQLEVLAGYGIDEATMGVPVRATMETVVVGEVEGLPIHLEAAVAGAGLAFLVARVKPHTDFRGSVESGLAKMTAIGLGKQTGAQLIHSAGIHGLRDVMPEAARLLAERGYVLGGLGIVENQRDETALIQGLTGAEFAGPIEEELLRRARTLMPRLPFDQLDVLVVDRMGKDISGTGMDTNVLNRARIVGEPEPGGLAISAVVVLDLTAASHGNAIGVGLADFTVERVLAKLDLAALYTNALTAGLVGFERGQLPIVLPTDRDAILAAIAGRGRPEGVPLRLAWITDTLHTETIAVSRALWDEAAGDPNLELMAQPSPMPVRADGSLEALLEWEGGAHRPPVAPGEALSAQHPLRLP